MREPLDARQAWEAIRLGSRSFAAASRLMEPESRRGAWLLYAWCRHCDDAIDGEMLGRAAGPAGGQQALGRLDAQTRRALAGEAMDEPVFAGLQKVVARHAIPHNFPLELLEGFAMDVEGRRYETLDDVASYSYHVAGTVGLMMALIMGVRDEPTLRQASALGIALQLTNIARDVIEDAGAGRVYLPEAWLREAGVPAEEVADREHRGRVAGVVERLLDAAEVFYRAGDAGIARLSFRNAWAVTVARGVYSEIGRLVRRRGARAWDSRAVVSRARKASWVARGLVRATVLSVASRLGGGAGAWKDARSAD